jgi:hypothetical protein
MASLLQRLKDAADFKPSKRTVKLTNGETIDFYASPLTLAEREAATNMDGGDTPTGFGINLLVLKAVDDTGRRLFAAGEIAELKNEVLDSDMQEMMLAILRDPSAGASIDMKSTEAAGKK